MINKLGRVLLDEYLISQNVIGYRFINQL